MDARRSYAGRTVLVTGGAGFLGSHLCERLLDLDSRVICLDDFSTGSPDNVAHLLERPGFQLVRHDVTRPYLATVDRVFNLACPASPVHYQADPVQTTKTSVIGALNMLELARVNRAVVLQTSTSEVYGDPDRHPQPESYWGHVNPIGPRACYDEGKRCAESLFFDYHRQHDVAIKVVRIFNTYGPRMSAGDGRIVSNLIVQALCGEPLTVYGSGRQTRSFCYVEDMVDGLVAMMASPARVIGPVNLGNPTELTVLELAHLVKERTGSRSPIQFKPLPEDDPRKRRPVIRRARSLLGWQPRVPLEDGLDRTIAYFDRQLRELPAPAASTAAAAAVAPASAGGAPAIAAAEARSRRAQA